MKLSDQGRFDEHTNLTHLLHVSTQLRWCGVVSLTAQMRGGGGGGGGVCCCCWEALSN